MVDINIIKKHCINIEMDDLFEYLRIHDDQNEYHERFVNRFVKKIKTDFMTKDNLLEEILHAYESYYVSVFYEKEDLDGADSTLLKQLLNLVDTEKDFKTMDEVERHIKDLFAEKGYIFRGGKTSNYYGPYIWQETEDKIYEVQIPEGMVKLPVHFMKGYVMNSWLSYLSFDLTGTGGWSDKDGLYCNFSRYEKILDSPKFNISFLKHESQHFQDYLNNDYKINVTTLEYRAKLCELTYYPNMDLFKSFMSTAKDNDLLTHSQAEFWLVNDLSKRIFNQEYVGDFSLWENQLEAIREHARQLILEYHRCQASKG